MAGLMPGAVGGWLGVRPSGGGGSSSPFRKIASGTSPLIGPLAVAVVGTFSRNPGERVFAASFLNHTANVNFQGIGIEVGFLTTGVVDQFTVQLVNHTGVTFPAGEYEWSVWGAL